MLFCLDEILEGKNKEVKKFIFLTGDIRTGESAALKERTAVNPKAVVVTVENSGSSIQA